MYTFVYNVAQNIRETIKTYCVVEYRHCNLTLTLLMFLIFENTHFIAFEKRLFFFLFE